MKVLLVDDEDDIRKIGALSLRSVGRMECLTAATAEEGLVLARAHQPDVILMDMMMPGMDGLGALAALRADEALRGVPVIFMTAKVQRREIEHYLEVGASGVIQKPFDPMRLADEIRRILATRAS